MEESSHFARAGKQLLARCKPTSGLAYEVELVVAPKYNSLKHWAEVRHRMPVPVNGNAMASALLGPDMGSFTLQIHNGPHLLLQRITAANPFEHGAILNPIASDPLGAHTSGRLKQNKVHPEDGAGGKGDGGQTAMWELRLGQRSAQGLLPRMSADDGRVHGIFDEAQRGDGSNLTRRSEVSLFHFILCAPPACGERAISGP